MEETFRVPVLGAVISTCRFVPSDFVSGDSLLERRGMRWPGCGVQLAVCRGRDEHRAVHTHSLSIE